MDATKKRKIDENGVVISDTDAPIPHLSPEDARKMIDNFTPDQLLSILQDAVVHYPGVLDAVRSIADSDITQRKLFIRGLGWETTNENLRNLFSQYGELEEAVVITDKGTGKNKGYGFVTFKHVDGALIALREPSKKIDGRVTVTQLAAAGKSTGGNLNPADALMRKIYVANVPFDMPADKLLAVFSSYGEIEEGPLGFDKQTGKSKGFALFVYKTPEGAQAALADPVKTIDDRQLNCKLAIDGKKKPGGPAGGPGGVQAPGDSNGDGMGMAPPSLPGSVTGHYGGAGGPGSLGSYGGFQGPPQMGHHHLNSFPSSFGGQQQSSLGGSGGYGAGLGGPYGYNGPAGYGASSGTAFTGSGGGSGLGSVGGGFSAVSGGLGSSGPGSSLYRGPSGMQSGGYPETGHYNLSSASTAYPGQHHQSTGTSAAPKIPPSGMFSNVPPYYSSGV